MVAYPLSAAKLKEVDEGLQRNPKDPAALFERGQLLFDRGDVVKAVENFRSALANKPSYSLRRRTQIALFDAMSLLVQRDFNAHEKDLVEFEQLSKTIIFSTMSPEAIAEGKRRRAIYLLTTANGWEKQGKLLEALRAYIDFAAQANREQLMPSPGDPAVKIAPDAWVRGRIADLLGRATPEVREQLEEEIAKRRK